MVDGEDSGCSCRIEKRREEESERDPTWLVGCNAEKRRWGRGW